MKSVVVFQALAGLVLGLGATPSYAQPLLVNVAAQMSDVLQQASPDARAAFAITADGKLRHNGSGFVCAVFVAGKALTRIGLDALPGQTGADPAFCEYSDAEGPVARVVFTRDDPKTPVLSDDFCKGLTRRLKLRLGPGALPGNNRIEGPAQPSTLPSLPVRGEAVPLWRCTHIRAPLDVPTIVFDATALRPSGGWTILVTHTPRPPPCCASYVGPVEFTFFVLPLTLIGSVAGVAEPVYPTTVEGWERLRPGRRVTP
jgi:hypothetical protein